MGADTTIAAQQTTAARRVAQAVDFSEGRRTPAL
jgi:hypothetical protein